VITQIFLSHVGSLSKVDSHFEKEFHIRNKIDRNDLISIFFIHSCRENHAEMTISLSKKISIRFLYVNICHVCHCKCRVKACLFPSIILSLFFFLFSFFYSFEHSNNLAFYSVIRRRRERFLPLVILFNLKIKKDDEINNTDSYSINCT
jgi:hypothetical protein